MTGQNVSFIVTEGTIKKWKLTAAHAIYNDNRTAADLTDVKGEFYDKDGKPVLQFAAPKGHYTNQDNAVTLTGGVVAKSTQENLQGGKGGNLIAPQMVWSAKTNNVTASGGIELTFPEGKSTAQTCRFSLDFSKITLEGGVSSSIIAQ
jgi:LPS export ABC transporter protein LptC